MSHLWDQKQPNGVSREYLWINQPLLSSVLLLPGPGSSAACRRAPALVQVACAAFSQFPAPSVASLADTQTSGQQLTRFFHLSVLMF